MSSGTPSWLQNLGNAFQQGFTQPQKAPTSTSPITSGPINAKNNAPASTVQATGTIGAQGVNQVGSDITTAVQQAIANAFTSLFSSVSFTHIAIFGLAVMFLIVGFFIISSGGEK